MERRKLLCTASIVGMLDERGLSQLEISELVGEPTKVVTEYLKDWKKASNLDRCTARAGTKIPPWALKHPRTVREMVRVIKSHRGCESYTSMQRRSSPAIQQIVMRFEEQLVGKGASIEHFWNRMIKKARQELRTAGIKWVRV